MNLHPNTLSSPAKWILAGEHSVLRGGLALALPLRNYELVLKTNLATGKGLEFLPQSLSPIFQTLLLRLQKMGAKVSLMDSIRIELESNIPERAGLGSSAALCTALVRWAFPEAGNQYDLARELEGEFHGKSSGLDVAVVLAKCPILFQNGKVIQQLPASDAFRLEDLPITVHAKSQKPSTKDCIAQVQAWRERVGPGQALKMDDQMSEAAQLGWESLQKKVLSERLEGMGVAMEMARSVMSEWGLVPQDLAKFMDDLKAKGALGVKLTGAGLGGTVIALWPSKRYTDGF